MGQVGSAGNNAAMEPFFALLQRKGLLRVWQSRPADPGGRATDEYLDGVVRWRVLAGTWLKSMPETSTQVK